MSSWIYTFTGRKFYPLDPNVSDIDIRDIAHALSMQCRFTGHCREFYSVAQHSIHVAQGSREEDRLWGLLHDASEAYLCDVARPVKHDPAMETYRQAENTLMAAICERFGLPLEMPASVKKADENMLGTEMRQLMNLPADASLDPNACYRMRFTPMTPQQAKTLFLATYDFLIDGRAAA